ncbi:hypothetical protein Tco_0560092, partial [Tanacetum coccineum]
MGMMVITEMAGEMETEMAGETKTEIEEAMGMEIPIGMTKVICLPPVSVLTMTRWFEKMETVFHISNCPD